MIDSSGGKNGRQKIQLCKKEMNNTPKIEKNEEGTALIIVLGLIALISLMTISIVTFSQTSYQISKITCDRSKASYWAEGAVARAIWMVHYDKVTHTTRSLGKKKEKSEVERFQADGTQHNLKSYTDGKVQVAIFDASNGIDISGSNPTKYLKKKQSSFESDPEAFEEYKLFLNSVIDYVDTNDFVHLNGGFEKEDYEAEGMAPLPRNYQMQYREEILWIPNCENFFSPDQYGRMSTFRIIAPKGLRQLRGEDNFYSANANQIKERMNIKDQEQVDEILQARKAWTTKKIPLSDSLSPALIGNLQQKFSFQESGYYTLLINASPGKGLAGRLLTCTIQITPNLSTSSELRYYEWRFLR